MHQRLAKHIDRCLAIHSCVAVPSLGGFVTEPIAACYDQSTERAYPPREEVHFNEAISHRDGLLEQSYAKLYNLSLRRARVMLDEDVRALRSDLVSGRVVSLPSFGVFTLSDTGQLSFRLSNKDERPSLLAYGLQAVSMPRLSVQEEKVETLEQVETQTTALLPPGKVVAPERDANDFIHIRLSKRSLGYAAAAVAALVMLFLPIRSTTSSNSYEAAFAPADITVGSFWKENSTPPKGEDKTESLSESYIEVQTAPIEQEQFTIAGLPCYDAPIEVEEGYYYIVVTTLSAPERVEAYVNQKGKENFEGIIKNGKYYQIYVHKTPTATEAYNYMNANDLDAWAYHAKPKKEQSAS